MRWCFLTLFYSGMSPKAPGTAGSFLAALLGLPIVMWNAEMITLLAILIGIIAVKQIDIYEKNGGEHDNKAIVIDELVGQWLAMGIGAIFGFSYVMVVLSFIFFRIYDISKPSIIRRIDREVKGGWGVVLDDALAGILAGFSTLFVLKMLDIFHISVF